MNKLTFLIEPGNDAVDLAADLIVNLLTQREPGSPIPAELRTRMSATNQIEIIVEYPTRAVICATGNNNIASLATL